MESQESKGGKIRGVVDVIKAATHNKNCELPFYVADLPDVLSKLRVWRSKLPRVEPFYAIKCNSDPLVLKLLALLGVGFDCASKWEIDTVLECGAKASDIIYAHPYKSRSFLHHAAKKGIDLMTFDSVSELYKIKEIFPQARLVLRFHVPNVKAAFPLNDKFGCDLLTCRHLLEVASELDLNVVGISFHVGALCEDATAYNIAISIAREIFDIAEVIGFSFSILDIGGGYPGHSGSYEHFSNICREINKGLENYFPEDGYGHVRVIAEPGCYFVCSAFTLCTTIIGKKEVDSTSGQGEGIVKMMYYLSDGRYTSFGEGIEFYHFRMRPFLKAQEIAERPSVMSKLWGWTCCSHDCIMESCMLPIMEIGEHIIFENMGAYSSNLASNFNGFPFPTIRYIYPSKKCVDIVALLDKGLISCLSPATEKLTSAQQAGFICDDDSNTDLCRNG